MTQSLLVVDDDPEIARLLTKYLESVGFHVTAAGSVAAMERALAEGRFDLVVLDVMLPDGSGLDACRSMRGRGSATPVILLTALQEEVDRIVGLEMGADDYLPKPFNPRELAARIRAVLRRTSGSVGEPRRAASVRFAGFTAESDTRRVIGADGADVPLTGAEFDLLKVFLDRPGRVLSRDSLLDITKGREADPFDRSIDVLVSRIRRKLGEPEGPILKTVRNGGYQFCARVEQVA